MIRTHAEYQNALERLAKDREVLAAEEQHYRDVGLSNDEVERALEPHRCFHEQLREEVAWYESVRRGDPQCIESLQYIGRILIAMRIAAGLSQRELANRLEVDESQISRDERNEYHGVTVVKVDKVLQALGIKYKFATEAVARQAELQPVGHY